MKRIFFIVVFFSCATAAYTQTFNEYLKQQQQDFQNYQSEIDKQFTKFLTQEWEEFLLTRGIQPFQQEKPPQLPTIKKDKSFTTTKKLQLPTAEVRTSSKLQLGVSPKEHTQKLKKTKVFFFGSTIVFTHPVKLVKIRLSNVNNQSVSHFFDAISKLPMENLQQQLQEVKEKLQLNDWGYYVLIKELSKKIYTHSNEQKLFQWFQLLQSGYRIKVGSSQENIILMIATQQELYAVPYTTQQKIKYYFMEKNIQKIKTYGKNYPLSQKSFDLSLIQFPLLPNKKTQNRTLSFVYNTQKYEFVISSNENLIRFLDTYPQGQFKIFMNTVGNNNTQRALSKILKEEIQNYNTKDKINFLLRFVQKAFPYKTDDEQFSKENFLFPNETLFYAYSDCEDRTALFVYLAREIIGIKEIILLHFPNHLAPAIYLPNTTLDGKSYNYRGKKYVIADPTYIGANVGMVMNMFKNSKPRIIPL